MDSEKYTFTTESYFEYKGVLDMYPIFFYTTYMLINNDTIQYSKVQKVSKYKTGLRILTTDRESFDIPCDQEIKRKIFGFFKCLNENTVSIDMNKVIGTAIIQFGESHFIVFMTSTSYEDFRKLVLKRIAFHFYPKDKHQIQIDHFEEFRFYIRESNIRIPLDNNSDLASALFHYNNRITVFITNGK
ncbi:uncharacterized protein VNE69_03241 [Vairimorpha necatrix]|uniref:Uncharacterized protein n=1 Tax=Vairimorpha necatrix TaxID=6039 RepID=A0AAX4JAM0_9MICR